MFIRKKVSFYQGIKSSIFSIKKQWHANPKRAIILSEVI